MLLKNEAMNGISIMAENLENMWRYQEGYESYRALGVAERQ